MVSRIRSAGIGGIDGYPLLCECDLARGLPSFEIVGLPDAAVKEARGRVRSAIKNSGFDFPLGRLTINLAPADLKKEGTLYDLPIFLGILSVSGQISPVSEENGFIGELSLEGRIRPVNGVLPMALEARRIGLRSFFVPEENALEAAAAGITVYPARSVGQIIDHLEGRVLISPASLTESPEISDALPDFSDVMGQENVKRALEIAAAGRHNVLLCGPPGSGKSMLAGRLPSILPDMTWEESIEATKIYSVAGLLDKEHPIIRRRPYRAPHHTVSAAALAGGGSGRSPRPGEVSLAHNGVLFLDELPEFHKDALEVLRQPLENGTVTISRVYGSCQYPSKLMLICAMNPCKCGWYGHPSGKCTCSPQSVARYVGKISGPLLDRIDLHVPVPSVEYSDLSARTPAEPSSVIKARVNAARNRQLVRYQGTGILCNGDLTPGLMKKFCSLDESGDTLMARAFQVLGLTARSHDHILKVARTIADLDGQEQISAEHLAEALQFRSSGFAGSFPG